MEKRRGKERRRRRREEKKREEEAKLKRYGTTWNSKVLYEFPAWMVSSLSPNLGFC